MVTLFFFLPSVPPLGISNTEWSCLLEVMCANTHPFHSWYIPKRDWMEHANVILMLKFTSWGPLWPHGYIIQLCVVVVIRVSAVVRDLVLCTKALSHQFFYPLDPQKGVQRQYNTGWLEKLLRNSVEWLRWCVFLCARNANQITHPILFTN